MAWRAGSETMVGHTGFLLGIVAAVMAIILAYVQQSQTSMTTLTLFSLSLAVFLVAAEQFSEALDFEDKKRYLRAIKLYNLGVVLMLWGLAALMLLFGYVPPTIILVGFSFYWIREIFRTVRPLKTKNMRVSRNPHEPSQTEPDTRRELKLQH